MTRVPSPSGSPSPSSTPRGVQQSQSSKTQPADSFDLPAGAPSSAAGATAELVRHAGGQGDLYAREPTAAAGTNLHVELDPKLQKQAHLAEAFLIREEFLRSRRWVMEREVLLALLTDCAKALGLPPLEFNSSSPRTVFMRRLPWLPHQLTPDLLTLSPQSFAWFKTGSDILARFKGHSASPKHAEIDRAISFLQMAHRLSADPSSTSPWASMGVDEVSEVLRESVVQSATGEGSKHLSLAASGRVTTAVVLARLEGVLLAKVARRFAGANDYQIRAAVERIAEASQALLSQGEPLESSAARLFVAPEILAHLHDEPAEATTKAEVVERYIDLLRRGADRRQIVKELRYPYVTVSIWYRELKRAVQAEENSRNRRTRRIPLSDGARRFMLGLTPGEMAQAVEQLKRKFSLSEAAEVLGIEELLLVNWYAEASALTRSESQRPTTREDDQIAHTLASKSGLPPDVVLFVLQRERATRRHKQLVGTRRHPSSESQIRRIWIIQRLMSGEDRDLVAEYFGLSPEQLNADIKRWRWRVMASSQPASDRNLVLGQLRQKGLGSEEVEWLESTGKDSHGRGAVVRSRAAGEDEATVMKKLDITLEQLREAVCKERSEVKAVLSKHSSREAALAEIRSRFGLGPNEVEWLESTGSPDPLSTQAKRERAAEIIQRLAAGENADSISEDVGLTPEQVRALEQDRRSRVMKILSQSASHKGALDEIQRQFELGPQEVDWLESTALSTKRNAKLEQAMELIRSGLAISTVARRVGLKPEFVGQEIERLVQRGEKIGPPPSLSARTAEVIRRLATGEDTDSVAASMGLTSKQVRTVEYGKRGKVLKILSEHVQRQDALDEIQRRFGLGPQEVEWLESTAQSTKRK